MTEQYLEFLSLTGDCTGLSESIHVKMPHCWKSHVTAHLFIISVNYRGSIGFGNDSIYSLLGNVGNQDVKDVQVLIDQDKEILLA